MDYISLIAPFPHKFESLSHSSSPGYTLFIFLNSMFIVNIKVQTCRSEGAFPEIGRCTLFRKTFRFFLDRKGNISG